MSNKQIEAISLEQAAKLALEALEYVDAPLNDETVDLWEQKTDAAITALREALMSVPDGAEQPAQQEPYKVVWPEYHEQAMGCGLEDRDEHCRYGAMRYGWDCAIEAVAQAIPDVIYTTPQAQPAREPLTDEQAREVGERAEELMGHSGNAWDTRFITWLRRDDRGYVMALVEAKLKEKNA